MRIVEEATLRQRVQEDEAMASAQRAFRALAEDKLEQPPPMSMALPQVRGEVHVKGAYLTGSPIFAIKVASGFYLNPQRGLPSGSGLVLVFDATSGFPVALLRDNAYLTDLRTAAAGALAVRLLAPRSIERVAVLGSGVQARFQMLAISRVIDWRGASAWSPHRQNRERYCREMEARLGKPFSPASHPREAVVGAGLIITVTTSREPLVEASWVAPGATVVAVGSDGPEKQELEARLLGRADKVIADRLSQCVRLGEIHHAVAEGVLREQQVYAELGDVWVGKKPGREGDELIVCDLTGVGAQDAAIAEVAWNRLQG